jgi:hypothetical protein
MCYVRSDSEVRGTGKSALMAAIYWDLKQNSKFSERFYPVWVTVHDFRSVTQLMGRVLDSFVASGIIEVIRKNVKHPVIPNIVGQILKPLVPTPNPSTLLAISKILAVNDYELAWKYTNIKRSVPTTSHLELLTYFMLLFKASSTMRVFVFIDQFEEFVEYQKTGAGMLQLANNMKDLYRTASECDNIGFVLSLHPTSQRDFEQSAKEVIESYGEIMDNAATVEPLSNTQLVKIAEQYIMHYRSKDAPRNLDNDFPFTEEALEFIASRCQKRPRYMIRYCQYSMMEAAIRNPKIMDREFLNKPEVSTRINLPAPLKKRE